jgi:hypothetical protein
VTVRAPCSTVPHLLIQPAFPPKVPTLVPQFEHARLEVPTLAPRLCKQRGPRRGLHYSMPTSSVPILMSLSESQTLSQATTAQQHRPTGQVSHLRSISELVPTSLSTFFSSPSPSCLKFASTPSPPAPPQPFSKPSTRSVLPSTIRGLVLDVT